MILYETMALSRSGHHVEIPEEIKELIKQDSELRYLIESLGYDYKNL